MTESRGRLERLLADPEFVYRRETEPANVAPGRSYRISDVALASRLSFFLWSSIPDDELMTLAAQGRLRDPAVLEQQVRRMIADPRSAALVANFTGQWLNVRGMQAADPVVNVFPDFDDNLRQAFRRETELFFDSIVREDRSVLDLLTARFHFRGRTAGRCITGSRMCTGASSGASRSARSSTCAAACWGKARC